MSSYEKKTTTSTTLDKKEGSTTRVGSYSFGSTLNDTQKVAEAEGGGIRDPEKKGGFFSGILDAARDAVSGILGKDKNTRLEDLPADLLGMLEDDTILRFAFGPEDMGALALSEEKDALEQVANILTVNNPSKAVMEYLIDSGKFTDMIWSGHGSEEGLFTTDEKGDAELMNNEDITKMLDGSSIEEVFLAVCEGGDALDEMLNDVGISTYAYDRKVSDVEAIDDLAEYAQSGELEDVEGKSIRLPDLPFFTGGNLGEIYIGGRHQRGNRKARPQVDLSNIDFSNMNFGDFGFGAFAGLDFSKLNTGGTAADLGGPAPGPTTAASTKPAPVSPLLVNGLSPTYEAGAPTWQASQADRGITGFNLGGLSYLNHVAMV